jgi:uncharacterized protein (TIGR02246 family)
MRSTLFALCAVIILVSAQAQAQTAREAIETANAKFQDAFNRGDAAALAQMYTPDGAVLPPDVPRSDGREAVQRFWQGAIDAGLRELTLQTTEVEEVGDIAYEVGTGALKATAGGTAQAVSVKYVVIWRRGEEGTWRLHRDIWNMNPTTAT